MAANVSVTPSREALKVITPSGITPGFYELKCSFGGVNGSYNSTNYIQFYGIHAVTALSVNETLIGTAVNTTVTGSGFSNTRRIKCIADKSNIEIPATYISNTSVVCHIPHIPRSLNLKLSLSFSSFDRSHDSGRALAFSTFINAPRIISCKITDNLQRIRCLFDKKVEPLVKSENCSNYFQNTSKFGMSAKCNILQPTVIAVELLGRPTVLPGASITLISTRIKVRGAELTKYPNSTQTVNVGPPSRTIKPKAVLVAPDQLGEWCIIFIFWIIVDRNSKSNWLICGPSKVVKQPRPTFAEFRTAKLTLTSYISLERECIGE